MKSALISIRPKWCELIASGKKTVEVRKNRPMTETPFKCYIYCTKNAKSNTLHLYTNSGYGRKNFGTVGHWRSGKDVVDVNSHLPAYRYNAYLAEGKVIGEFVCDEIKEVTADNLVAIYFNNPQESTCLNDLDMRRYADGKNLFLWHISNLVIYDKPKGLNEFFYACDKPKGTDCSVCLDRRENKCKAITRPPQSWCYVEEPI